MPSPVVKPTPRVSIGVPVYNGERYLARTLESLLAQTFSDFEVIITDNASTDATAEIGRAFAARDCRIRYHRAEQNQGVAANFLWALASSKAHRKLAATPWFCSAR